MGELFQNNHHYAKDSANFAKKWFEFDLTYFIMRGLNKLGLIRLKPVAVPVDNSMVNSVNSQ
jgi:stearoyl-CoA desaturase (delta-9 desaturase)